MTNRGPSWTAEELRSVVVGMEQSLGEIAMLGAVTGAEHRLYRWLLQNIAQWQSRCDTSKLRVSFLNGSQMLVSWNGGAPEHKRTLLVAHADHEGYRVLRHDPIGGAPVVEAATVSGPDAVEAWRSGGTVRVFCSDDPVHAAPTIGQISEVGGSKGERNVVRIRLGSVSEAERVTRPGRPAFAEHFFGQPVSAIPADRDPFMDQLVSAPYIDNCAGVAICTSVMERAVADRVPSNLSVLYTSGEEAGFIGLLDVLHMPELPAELREAVWIIVDSSPVRHSHAESVHRWVRRTSDGARDVTHRPGGVPVDERCPPEATAIRLADKWTIFDAGVAVRLYQAAIGARHDCLGAEGLGPRFPGAIGVAGEFVGGYCEGSVLALYSDLVLARDGREDVQPFRFGSLAIPIENYRNAAIAESIRLEAEFCTRSSLLTALLILQRFVACAWHAPDILGRPARSRGTDALCSFYPDNERESLDARTSAGILLNDYALGKGMLEDLRQWVATEGHGLGRDLGACFVPAPGAS